MKIPVKIWIFILIIFGFVVLVLTTNKPTPKGLPENQGGLEESLNSLSIEYIKKQNFPGSNIVFEQKLPAGSNYSQYVVSYKSDGLKIYALLTIPESEKPQNGVPVIIFNHGYIPPQDYRTTERYIAYVDAFSKAGYIVFKPDYRGHGNSEGRAEGGYGSNAYTIDVLNALASLKDHELKLASGESIKVDPQRIGMWGHSMGGFITLRTMVISKDIKAGVIWAGVVASYPDLLNSWRRRSPPPGIFPSGSRGGWRQGLIEQNGTPEQNPQFWNSISANSFLNDLSAPVQLHHAKDDSHVPFIFSDKLYKELQRNNKVVELYSYQGDDHNLTESFNTAMERSIAFFDKYI